MRIGRILRRLIGLLPSVCAAASLFGACTFPDVQINPAAECAVDADCVQAGLGSFCSEAALCIVCRTDADCGGGRCDAQTGACLECVTEADCPEGEPCAGGICVECVAHDDCEGGCVDGHCVTCVEDEHCPDGVCLANACVACTEDDDSHCEPSESCQQNLCIADHCDSGVMDFDETGQDCGGSCLPCANDGGCLVGTDCTSGFCDDGTCAPCASATDCSESDFCLDERCVPRLPVGSSCPNVAGACVQDAFCVDGICCESACDQTCMGCSQFETGQPDGQCTQAQPGTPCSAIGVLNGKCYANGTCGL